MYVLFGGARRRDWRASETCLQSFTKTRFSDGNCWDPAWDWDLGSEEPFGGR